MWPSNPSNFQGPDQALKGEFQDCSNYAFEDQLVQGTINDKSWKLVNGFANQRNILLCNEEIDICASQGLRRANYIRINMKPRISLGTFDIQSPPGQPFVVDVKNVWEGVPCYNCSACGRLEITKIDTEANILYGAIDARWKDGDRVNGTFAVPICP